MEVKKFIILIVLALPLLILGLQLTTGLLSLTEAKLYQELNITISSIGFCEVEMLGDYSHTGITPGNCEVNGTTFMIKKNEAGNFELFALHEDCEGDENGY